MYIVKCNKIEQGAENNTNYITIGKIPMHLRGELNIIWIYVNRTIIRFLRSYNPGKRRFLNRTLNEAKKTNRTITTGLANNKRRIPSFEGIPDQAI